jgi:peptidoglycan/LPS O-acetylase OafA/YrhL
LHWIGVYVVQSFYPLPMAQKLLALGTGWAAVAAASWAIYAWTDRPLERLRHAYVQRLTNGSTKVHVHEAERVSPGR